MEELPWKACLPNPWCECSYISQNPVLITITGCRHLIPVGTCVSLQKKQPLYWSFSVLHALLIAPPQWHILPRCSSHITRSVGLVLSHIFFSLPSSCILVHFHSASYWKSQHTWFTVHSIYVGSLLQQHICFGSTLKAPCNTRWGKGIDTGRAARQCQGNSTWHRKLDCSLLFEVFTKYTPEKGDMSRICRRGPCRRSWEALTSTLLSNYIGLDRNAEKIF